MSSPLQNNTTTLQNILNIVNDLPESRVVQKKSGTFTVDEESNAYVDCGFIPDFVLIHINESRGENNVSTAVSFTEDTRQFWLIHLLSESGIYEIYPFTVNSFKGFCATIFKVNWDWSYSESAPTSTIFHYTAVKYT